MGLALEHYPIKTRHTKPKKKKKEKKKTKTKQNKGVLLLFKAKPRMVFPLISYSKNYSMYLYVTSTSDLCRTNNNSKKKNRKLETKTNKTYSDQNLIDDVDHVIMYFLFCYFCIQRPKTWSVFFFIKMLLIIRIAKHFVCLRFDFSLNDLWQKQIS